jgi:AcrR family transcriptional regulator
MVLFWRKGFAATSMNDLCGTMGVGSPSLYAAFGSKEALYLEAIEHYVQTQGPPVWYKLAEGATARTGIRNLLNAAINSMPRSRATPAGCMAALAAVGDECPTAIVRLEMLGMLRARMETAASKGELPDSTDIDGLSRFYLSVYQGNGHSGPGRSHPGGVESRSHSGNGCLAGHGWR